MGALITTNQQEKIALQGQTGLTTNFSLHDVRTAFYGGKISQNDALRAYLQSQTGLTGNQSLGDLWRQFFILKGAANQMSLGDMARYFFTNIGFSTQPSPLLTGLISYWKYDENTGTAVGDSVGSNTGTWHGTGTHWTPGKINSGGLFNGSDDYVQSVISSQLSGSFTYAAWVKMNLLVPTGTIAMSFVAVGSTYWFVLDQLLSGGPYTFQAALYDGTHNPFVAGATTLSTATLYHVAFVRDTSAGKIILYVNGSQDAIANDTTTSVPTYTNFLRGIDIGRSGNDKFNGMIDEEGLWSRALSTSDLALLYNSGAGRQYPF